VQSLRAEGRSSGRQGDGQLERLILSQECVEPRDGVLIMGFCSDRIRARGKAGRLVVAGLVGYDLQPQPALLVNQRQVGLRRGCAGKVDHRPEMLAPPGAATAPLTARIRTAIRSHNGLRMDPPLARFGRRTEYHTTAFRMAGLTAARSRGAGGTSGSSASC